MKKYLRSAAAALALTLALASCSLGDPEIAQEPSQNPVGYLNLKINTSPGDNTRAGDDGLESEYKVSNAKLLVFRKGDATSEDGYTYVTKFLDSNLDGWQKDDREGITSSRSVVMELSEDNMAELAKWKDDELFLLLQLNYDTSNSSNQSLDPDADAMGDDRTYGKYKIRRMGSVYNTDYTGTKLLYMSNAPLYDPENKVANTLVPFQPSKVYNSLPAAMANEPAAEITVQRAAVKVTLQQPQTSYTITSDGQSDNPAYQNATVSITNWQIENLINCWYMCQTVDNSWFNSSPWGENSSFTSSKLIGRNNRILWAIDPDYDQALRTPNIMSVEVKPSTEILQMAKFGNENPKYCSENTFDAQSMTKKLATYIKVLAQFKLDGTTPKTFVTINGVVYDNVADANAYLAEKAKKFIAEQLPYVSLTGEITGNLTDNAGCLKDGVVYEAKTLFTGAGWKDIKDNGYFEDAQYQALLAYLGQIYYYRNGQCYYRIYPYHFADVTWTETDVTGKEVAKGADGLYPIDKIYDNRHTGRYGLVRNHWYDIEIQGVYGPGFPGEPPTPDEPIDTPEEKGHFLKTSIRILDWEKHSFTPILK